jgi:hypothetical protein
MYHCHMTTSAFAYVIVDKRDNLVQMVGKTIHIDTRFNAYESWVRRNRNEPLYIHMRSEGIEHFELRPILEFEYEEYGGRKGAEEAAYLGERYLIALIRKNGYETYNLNAGGRGLLDPSPETRAKMGIASAARRGKATPETRALQRVAALLRTCTVETRAKMSKSHSKPVVQMTLEGAFVELWPSMLEAAQALGICKSNISECCRNVKKHAGGFVWRRASDI